MQLQIALKPSILCYHHRSTNEEGDSAFCQIILSFLSL